MKLFKVASMLQRKLAEGEDRAPEDWDQRSSEESSKFWQEVSKLTKYYKDQWKGKIDPEKLKAALNFDLYKDDEPFNVRQTKRNNDPDLMAKSDILSSLESNPEDWIVSSEEGSSEDPRHLTPEDAGVLHNLVGNLIANDIITKDLEYFQGLLEKLQYLKES